MNILSALNKKTEEEVSGEYRSQAQEERSEAFVKSDTRRKSNKKNNDQDDPSLPEKKRARRRLIGALAITLTLVVGLPMIFDNEPHVSLREIQIQIPAKESGSAVFAADQEKEIQVPELDSPISSSGSSVATAVTPKSEESPKDLASTLAKTEPRGSRLSAALDEKDVILAPKIDNAKVVAKDAEKERKNEDKPKLDATKDIARDDANKRNDAQRAMAILEGKPVKDVKDKPSKIVYQVAALSSAKKISELQKQISALNINTMTQKVDTPNGEVTRLRVGPFASQEEADIARKKLLKLGLNANSIAN
jgi:DedD protein